MPDEVNKIFKINIEGVLWGIQVKLVARRGGSRGEAPAFLSGGSEASP
jgi:hypothetical protein